MAHGERCPVCNGTGMTNKNKGSLYYTTDGGIEVTCHGCWGTGWITVSDK